MSRLFHPNYEAPMLETLLSARRHFGGELGYQDFLNFIASKNITDQPVGNSFSTISGYRKVTYSAETGTMWGTPWLNYPTYDSTAGRILRHCFPDKATADENLVTKRVVLLKLQYQGTRSSYVSLARNGYTSYTYGSFSGQQVIDFIYFDAALGKAMRLNPFLGESPKVFNSILLT